MPQTVDAVKPSQGPVYTNAPCLMSPPQHCHVPPLIPPLPLPPCPSQGAVLLEDLTNVVNRISRAMEDGSLLDLMRNAVPVLPAPEPSTPLADSTSQGNTPRIRKQVFSHRSTPI